MYKRNVSKYALGGKVFLLIVALCVIITSIAVYAKSIDNIDSSSNLELILNENEIEYVEELPNAEFYIGAKQLFSDSTQDILDPSSLVWSTSDNKIAEIKENGAIVPKSTGTVIITGEYKGLKACSTIDIEKGEIIDLSVTDKHLTLTHSLYKKDLQSPYELVLVATTTAGNKYDLSYNRDVVWKSDNRDVETIGYGQVFSLKPGNAKITASFKGLTTETEINFVDNKIINIRFGEKAIKLEDINVSQEIALFADFNDGSSVDISKNATWKSQDPEVAIVNGGMLISKGLGATEIIATYEAFSCAINVSVEKSENYTSECIVFP